MITFKDYLEHNHPDYYNQLVEEGFFSGIGRGIKQGLLGGVAALSLLGGPGQAQAQNPGGGVRGLPSGRVMQDEESPSGQNAPSSAGIIAGDLASDIEEAKEGNKTILTNLKQAFDGTKTRKEKAQLANKISEEDRDGIQKSQKVGNIWYYAFANPEFGAAAQRGGLNKKVTEAKATSSAIKEAGGSGKAKAIVLRTDSVVSGDVVITAVAVKIMKQKFPFD